MTVPATLSTFTQILETDPTSPNLPQLARQLADRLELVTTQLDEAGVPVSLLPLDRYRDRHDQLNLVRRHLQAYGVDVMPVRSITGNEVVLYVHQLQAQPGMEDAS